MKLEMLIICYNNQRDHFSSRSISRSWLLIASICSSIVFGHLAKHEIHDIRRIHVEVNKLVTKSSREKLFTHIGTHSLIFLITTIPLVEYNFVQLLHYQCIQFVLLGKKLDLNSTSKLGKSSQSINSKYCWMCSSVVESKNDF